MTLDARPTLLAPDDDPYLWLEDIDGEAACAWADRQSAATIAALGGLRLDADTAALLALLDRPDRIPYVSRRGGLLYNFWRDDAFLREVSAYHAAEAGRRYPPILVATSRRDDRVHPGHARKFAAKLEALGCAVRFYEPAAGGHGYGKDNAEIARFQAIGLTFLRRAIGWEEGPG